MNGLLSRQPYPNDAMTDCIAVASSGSTLTLSRPDPNIETRVYDGTPGGRLQPSAAGDVLSRTGGKTWEGRVPGTNGSWEQVAINGALAVYDAAGDPNAAEGFLYWSQVPNV